MLRSMRSCTAPHARMRKRSWAAGARAVVVVCGTTPGATVDRRLDLRRVTSSAWPKMDCFFVEYRLAFDCGTVMNRESGSPNDGALREFCGNNADGEDS